MQVSYLTMGLNRGTPRLWLEGRRLGKAGFEPGARYRIEANTDDWSLRLVLDPAGNRRVSGKKRGTTPLPIIDLCDAGLAPAGTRVRAVIERGVITITIHHEAMNRHTREAAIATVARGERPLREATICVGIGISTAALHQGLEESGVDAKVDWIVDVEGRYLDMADRNVACITDDTRLFQAAVEEVEPDLVTPVDLLSMSLPCTNHSKAGKSKRGIKVAEEGADAATCLFGAVALIRASNPALVTSENVLEARSSTMYLLLQHELMRVGYRLFEPESAALPYSLRHAVVTPLLRTGVRVQRHGSPPCNRRTPGPGNARLTPPAGARDRGTMVVV